MYLIFVTFDSLWRCFLNLLSIGQIMRRPTIRYRKIPHDKVNRRRLQIVPNAILKPWRSFTYCWVSYNWMGKFWFMNSFWNPSRDFHRIFYRFSSEISPKIVLPISLDISVPGFLIFVSEDFSRNLLDNFPAILVRAPPKCSPEIDRGKPLDIYREFSENCYRNLW